MRAFEKYLQSKNIHPTSIKKYVRQIERLKVYLEKDLEQVDKKDVLAYLEFIGLSNRTKQHILGIIRHYYNHLEISNPTNLIQIRGTRKKILYKILSIEELHGFIDLYYSENQSDLYLILSLIIYQGLSVSEWKNLRIEDIDLQKGKMTIAAQRKTNSRTLTLVPSQIGTLYAYMREIEDKTGLLFTRSFDIQKWTKKLRKIYPKFTDFKQIRASIITYWIQTEGLRKAQYKAGHRYISSTENYLSNDLDSLKDDISQFHPL